jgi:hypothetical protein
MRRTGGIQREFSLLLDTAVKPRYDKLGRDLDRGIL